MGFSKQQQEQHTQKNPKPSKPTRRHNFKVVKWWKVHSSYSYNVGNSSVCIHSFPSQGVSNYFLLYKLRRHMGLNAYSLSTSWMSILARHRGHPAEVQDSLCPTGMLTSSWTTAAMFLTPVHHQGFNVSEPTSKVFLKGVVLALSAIARAFFYVTLETKMTSWDRGTYKT